jgi:O-antigen/teichoic acid export membrane protein
MDTEGTRKPATGRQIARGAAWMMGLKLFERSIGLISTVILARLLTPQDFGLVAMAVAVVALLELMSAFGFDTALIQRQQTTRSHYDTAWTFNVLFGTGIAIFLLLLATPASAFYREPRLEQILQVLACSALLGGFENIGTVAFRKELDFRSEFRFLLAKRLVTFTVTVSLAFMFRNYWALIAGTVTGRLTSVLISYALHPYRPRFSLSARGDLFHFSKWILISNLVQFLTNRSTDFILGRTVGSHGLGIYNVAVEVATLPSSELIAPLNRAIFPAYSRLSHDLEALRLQIIAIFQMICLFVFPVSIGVLCVSDAAVRLLLGERWLEAIPIIQIASISGLASALQSNFYLAFLALGKPKAHSHLVAGVLAISLPGMVVGSIYFGTIGAAIALSSGTVLGLIAVRVAFTRVTGMRLSGLGAAMLRPALATTAMAIVVILVQICTGPGYSRHSPLTELLVLVGAGTITYGSSVMIAWMVAGRPAGAEQKVIGLLSQWFFSPAPPR